MKQLLVFVAVIAVSSCAFQSGLRVTFGSTANKADFGVKYFFDLPKDVASAEAAGFTLTTRPSGPLASLTMYCHASRTVCTLHEADTGHVAGLQIAVDQSVVTDTVLDFKIQGWTSWTPSNDGKKYWAIQQYFVDDAYLAKSADEREKSRDSSKTLQLDGVWASFNGGLIKISNTAAGLKASSPSFYKQNCIPRMGTHYYVNMSTSLTCTSETLVPWFVLVQDDGVIGSGLTLFGKAPVNPEREWLERQVRAGVSMAIPDAPTCLLDLIDSQGVITLHIYYVDNPQDIAC